MKPMLKPPGTDHLKLKCDIPLLTFAFKINLRRYSAAPARSPSPLPSAFRGPASAAKSGVTWHTTELGDAAAEARG